MISSSVAGFFVAVKCNSCEFEDKTGERGRGLKWAVKMLTNCAFRSVKTIFNTTKECHFVQTVRNQTSKRIYTFGVVIKKFFIARGWGIILIPFNFCWNVKKMASLLFSSYSTIRDKCAEARLQLGSGQKCGIWRPSQLQWLLTPY